MSNKILSYILGFLGCALLGVMFSFVIINWLLGCETWDERHWTYENSCVTPAMIVDSVAKGD
jgi:hypothetical protein